ncbi:MAG: hypothetical protein NVV74_07355 [Magnetospirillum sp.]|nr:hypothetical protein [Magnetospirillum sp.]
MADALPPIRSELRLVGRRHDPSGAEVGVVYDPLRHRFFELAPLAMDMLARWGSGARRLLEEVDGATAEDLGNLLQFLLANQLLARRPVIPPLSGFQRLEHAIGHLFFFRIPLVHPDRVVAALAEALAPLMHPAALAAMGGMAVLGLALVARQWDVFAAGFGTVFNTGGAASFILAVVLAKAIHELGHALAAKRMGCAVPAMGVAVVFGAPLLYTDLSDTWRLERRRQRLLVASGGILAETALAALATWGWLILPEGPARGACFFLATAAWAATLALNANPFMRFDGYFMLSDVMGVPNLQDRAFTLGRWAVRRLLWSSAEPCPDDAPPRLRAAMLVYAWTTWAVRLGIYLGLAFAAFHILPKVVAVPLLMSEIWVLVLRPIVRELAGWWRSRRDFLSRRRGRLTLAVLGGLFLWAAVPQSFQLSLPAIYAPASRVWMHPPRAAVLVHAAAEGARVQAGEVVAEFRDPELDHQAAQSRIRLDMLKVVEAQLATNLASAHDLAAQRQRIAEEQANLSGIEAQQAALILRAPVAGRIVESAPDLRPGLWRTPTDPLFLLASDGAGALTAYVDDRDLDLVRAGGSATFYPGAVDFPVFQARVETVETVPAETITEPLLASPFGGPIAAERDGRNRLVARQGQYRITATPQHSTTGATAMDGRLMVATRPHSILGLALRRLYAVVVRESGV